MELLKIEIEGKQVVLYYKDDIGENKYKLFTKKKEMTDKQLKKFIELMNEL